MFGSEPHQGMCNRTRRNMLRGLHMVSLVSTVLGTLPHVSETWEESSSAMFLQFSLQVAELETLTALLLEARKECLQVSEACPTVLEKIGQAVWPHVQALTNCSSTWPPPAQQGDAGSVTSPSGARIFFRHNFEEEGFNAFANLQEIGTHFTRRMYDGECKAYHMTDPESRKAFIFVSEPISRFLSVYAELEFEATVGKSWPRFDFLAKQLNKHKEGSLERAGAFVDEFLRTGFDSIGYVRPQLELFMPSGGCSMPIDFIGKTERLEEDWERMFAMWNETVPSYREIALKGHGDRDEHAMATFLNLPSSGRYMQALCWIFLADFAVFKYDLPEQCQQEPLQTIVASLRE